MDAETVNVVEAVAKSVGGCGVGGLLIWLLKRLKNKRRFNLRYETVDKDGKIHTTEVTLQRSCE